MVKKVEKNNKIYFMCEECNFYYEKEEIAKQCEDWCREKHSCNLDITKHAVNPDKCC